MCCCWSPSHPHHASWTSSRSSHQQKVLFMLTSVGESPCSSSCGIWYASIHAHDIVNDAAQLVAHLLHDAWWQSRCKQSDGFCVGDREYDISIFLSTLDWLCFISTGTDVSFIHVVTIIKPNLRRRYYGTAILRAIDDLVPMLEAGPLIMLDWLHDFVLSFCVWWQPLLSLSFSLVPGENIGIIMSHE